MSREFPDFIDPWKAADGRRTFQGTMPLKRMKRLAGMLAPEDGVQQAQLQARKDAGFRVRFSNDEQGLVIIHLSVEAELALVCQRSLTPYLEKIRRQSVLAAIEDIADQDDIPDLYDPVLVEHRRMALVDIVEEELILAVPQVPRNPKTAAIELSTDGAVRASGGAEKEQSHRPFAGLGGLMKEKSDD
jgi:uncharacterized protein